MKTKKTIIATSVALMMCASYGASAAQSPIEYHEDQWGNVVSYGNTPIAGDSVAEWGPWADFVQPAAGAPSVGFLPQGAGEVYRPLPVPVIPPTDEAVGYAVFQNNSYYYGDGGESVHPATFAVRIPQSLDENTATTAWRLTSLDGTTPNFSQSGELGNAFFWNNNNFFHFYRNDYSDNGYGGAYIGGYVPLEGVPLAVGDDELNGYNNLPDGGEGGFARDLQSYMSGDYSNYQRTHGVYVVGIPTAAADMSALRANSIQASYDGYAFQGAPVHMNVYFGESKWDGTWNNGADGTVNTYSRPGYVAGQVGFAVPSKAGTISGSTFQATTFTASDNGTVNTVTGKVQGSFYGKDAAALAGVADITKTRALQGQGPGPQAAMANPNTYSNQRYVDLFVAIKNEPR